MTFTQLETERLVIRRFEERDAQALVAYRNDPEVARFQGWQSYSVAQALALVADSRLVEPGTPGEWFQFAFVLKENDTLIGDCGLCVDEYSPQRAEVGYTLARAYHGRGLAGEGVGRIVACAFVDLQIQTLFARTDVENAPSIKLLERLGFRRTAYLPASFRRGDEWRDEIQYELSVADWTRTQARDRGQD